MKLLTRYTVLGLQLLGYLAVLSPQVRVNTAEIARYYRVSRYHMTKVVGHLTRLGYLNTKKGRQGGVILNRIPTSINLGSLVRELEQRYAINLFSNQGHPLKFHRGLVLILSAGLEAFFLRLNQFTLADLDIIVS